MVAAAGTLVLGRDQPAKQKRDTVARPSVYVEQIGYSMPLIECKELGELRQHYHVFGENLRPY